MFSRVYVEIGNICNLNCSFCPGTKRKLRQMSEEEFRLVCERLSGHTKQLYFHLMGEPLCHPGLSSLIRIAGEWGYEVCITTNGTLLGTRAKDLLVNCDVLHRVSISLHAPEGNGENITHGGYLDTVIGFAKELSAREVNAVFRLWNLDTDERVGENSQNTFIEARLREEYPEPWQKRYSGYRIAYRTFLEYDGIFTWPSESDADEKEEGTCHAMRRQIAVLADGTVVPCCLDSEGLMPLGNIFSEELDSILSSDMARAMQTGFREGRMVHPVCKKCTYARRF